MNSSDATEPTWRLRTARWSRSSISRRLRRLRRTAAMRALVRETRLSPDMFIYPLFVCEGEGRAARSGVDAGRLQAVGRRGGQGSGRGEGRRHSAACCCSGFPDEKDDIGSAAYDPEAPVQSAVRAIKREVPTLLVVTDVCLCEYTDPRPLRHHRGRRDRERSDRRSARARGGVARRGRRRHRRAVGHDGRPRRRASARRSTSAGFENDRDHVVRREVLLGLLRAVPRRRRDRRRSSATAGRTRWIRPTWRRRCARSRWTSRKAPTS